MSSPSPGVVLVNPLAGRQEPLRRDLEAAFAGLATVRPCDPADLGREVAALLDRPGGAPAFVGVAGGDGSLRTAAAALAGGDVPLLPVPCGTLNHFAVAAGITSVEEAVAAAVARRVVRVDVGTVGDEVFLNTASVGLYAALVHERGRRALPKRLADLVGAVAVAARGHRVRGTLDGRRVVAWVVWVGNGAYGETLAEITERDSLTDGRLDVRVVRADKAAARLRLLGSLVAGRLHLTPVLDRSVEPRLTLDVGRPLVEAALDGDALRLASPLRFGVRARALPVLVGAAYPRDAGAPVTAG